MVIDLSSLQHDPPAPTRRVRDGVPSFVERVKVFGGKTLVRAPEAITGITLHATGCYFGPDIAATKAGKPRAEAIQARALGVHAHMTCFRDGSAVLAYPRAWHVYHGHAFCPTDIGQEHEGNWGPDGKPINAPADYDLDAVIHAGREGIASHLAAYPSIRFVHLHRQTRGSKPACPGRIIAHEVGLWACRKFGLRYEPNKVWRDGKPIPSEWLEGEPKV